MGVAAEDIHTNESFGFPSLPLDVKLHLLNFLDPRDIIAVRKTCKILHQSTLQRQLWLHTLRRVCVADSIFAPSFPFTEMTTSELERAAVVPSLWASVDSVSNSGPDGDDQQLAYTTKRTLRGPTSNGGDDGTEFIGLFLVPGGRYLILFFNDQMSVCDLGYAPEHEVQLLASVDIRLDGPFLVHPSPDGLALRIFVSVEPTDDEDDLVGLDWQWCKYQIYEIYPHRDNPGLEVIFQWSTIQPVASEYDYSIHLNRIVFKFGSVLKVWDFVADTSATWRVADDIGQIIIANNTIGLFGKTGVSIWNLPALVPHDREHNTLPHVDIPILNACFQVDYLNLPNDSSTSEGPGDWYKKPWCYDDITQSEDGKFVISRYLMTFNEDITGGTIERTAGFEVPTASTNDDNICLEPYRICHGQLVMLWSGGSVIKAITSPLFSPDSVTQRLDKPLVLGEQEGIEHFQISLCPFSARLCFYSKDDHEVLIYDFRSPLA